MQTTGWTKTTRFLHLGLALTVTLQLFISLGMEAPGPGKMTASGIESTLFEAHEVVGLTALAFVLLQWIWVLAARDINLKHLFPLGPRGLAQIVRDLKTLVKGHLVGTEIRGGLPGLIHGFGLLAVTGMVFTGGSLFYFITQNALGTPIAHTVGEAHEVLSKFVWVYWAGHGTMAFMHHLAGHDTLRQMFSLRG